MANNGPENWPRRAAVVGTGTMGTGFAQILALAGVPCTVADASPALAAEAVVRAVSLAERFERDGLLPAGGAEAVAAGVRPAESVRDAASDADFVIEAVTEDPAVKRSVYTQIEAGASPDAVVSSNTSAIPIRDLSAALRRPERFLGTHWFNPPQWVPCVEVIPGPDTDEQVVARVVMFLRRLGKQAVRVGDRAGFVANRIQFAMFREAAAVVDEGVASAKEVDAVVRGSFGFRLPFFGPFAIADMAGLDVYAGAYESLESDFGSRFSAPDSLHRNVVNGRLGTKTLAGYLDHTEHEVARVAARRDASYLELARLITRTGAWEET